MYITGTFEDFTQRLHQLPTGQNDLNTFMQEASGYSGLISKGLLIKWNAELGKRASSICQSQEYYLTTGIVITTSG
jgi:hypothetical protein